MNDVNPIDAYQYNYTHLEPIAMVDVLPNDEHFSPPWLLLAGKVAIKLVINTLIANRGDRGEEGIDDDVRKFLGEVIQQTLREEGTSFKSNLIDALATLFPKIGELATLDTPDPSTTVEDIARRIEDALKQLLQKSSTVPDVSSANMLTDAVRDKISSGLIQVLQKPLEGMPFSHKSEKEVADFVTSQLVEILGKDFLRTFAKNILSQLSEESQRVYASSIEDYLHLYTPEIIPPPKVADTFQSDEFFAYMRVAGPNPVMIQRMDTPDTRFPVTEEQYRAVMGADSLATAMREGRVYLADYAILNGALNGTFSAHQSVQKYAYAPLAMFAVPVAGSSSDRLLRPVAIQCGQDPAAYPVITPSSGTNAWMMAKTIVQIADVNFHEAVTHFARTHLLVEPFVISTHRRLPDAHPLSKLLIPHFQGTLAINFAAHQLLIAPKGGVNKLLSSTIDNSRVFMVKGFQVRGFNADMLPQQLQARGVDDVSKLPVYPYRDDGLLIWEAIHSWVKSYLSLYYKSDHDVLNDPPLQKWAQELVAFDGGRLSGFGDRGDGVIATLSYLIDAVTMVIFTASAQHAAVNFPQGDIMSFTPAMPTAGYIPPQAVKAGATEQDWLNLLPPLDQAQTQLNLLYLLGSVYFTTLGEYGDHFNGDPNVTETLKAFQNRLQEIEAEIVERNKRRPPYDYLKPSKIPQSINI